MDINIQLKLRSLVRRKSKFYCLSYDWESKEIVLHNTQQQYITQLGQIKNNGLVKRLECFVDEPLLVNQSEKYLIYLVSFGDFRKSKMVKGENPIAKGLGYCIFDYVYLFLDQFAEGKKRMQERIRELQRKNQDFQANKMLQIYLKFFRHQEKQQKNTPDFFQGSQLYDTIIL